MVDVLSVVDLVALFLTTVVGVTMVSPAFS
jgi:hypothetical protein